MPAALHIRPSDLFTPDDWAPFQVQARWPCIGPRLREVAAGYIEGLEVASARRAG